MWKLLNLLLFLSLPLSSCSPLSSATRSALSSIAIRVASRLARLGSAYSSTNPFSALSSCATLLALSLFTFSSSRP